MRYQIWFDLSLMLTSMATQAVDALTPLGRGQAQLVTGPPSAGKSRCGIDAVLGQVRVGVDLRGNVEGQWSRSLARLVIAHHLLND